LTISVESNRSENFTTFGLSLENTFVLENEGNNRVFSLVSVDIVLDVESSNFVGGRETFDLSVVDSSHKGRLSRPISSTKTVSVSSLQPQSSRVQQNLGTVSEGESTVTEILTLLLVFEYLNLLSLLESTLLQNITNDSSGGVGSNGVGKSQRDVRNQTGVPFGHFEVPRVDEGSDEGSDVLNERGTSVEGSFGFDLLDGNEDDGGTESGSLDFERGELGSVAVSLSDLSESLDGFNDNSSRFGIGDSVLDFDESGKELGKERSDGVFVVDEFGHVVDNNSDLSDGRSKLLSQSSREKRSHEGESRGVDL
jgi:hypothetical protein